MATGGGGIATFDVEQVGAMHARFAPQGYHLVEDEEGGPQQQQQRSEEEEKQSRKLHVVLACGLLHGWSALADASREKYTPRLAHVRPYARNLMDHDSGGGGRGGHCGRLHPSFDVCRPIKAQVVNHTTYVLDARRLTPMFRIVYEEVQPTPTAASSSPSVGDPAHSKPPTRKVDRSRRSAHLPPTAPAMKESIASMGTIWPVPAHRPPGGCKVKDDLEPGCAWDFDREEATRNEPESTAYLRDWASQSELLQATAERGATAAVVQEGSGERRTGEVSPPHGAVLSLKEIGQLMACREATEREQRRREEEDWRTGLCDQFVAP